MASSKALSQLVQLLFKFRLELNNKDHSLIRT